MEATTNIDYIAMERDIRLEFHGAYVFVPGDNKLELFETAAVRNLQVHPLTGQKMSKAIQDYIQLNVECYDLTGDMLLTPESLQAFFTWYDESRNNGVSIYQLMNDPTTSEAYNIVRFYLTATDFQAHFKDFDPADSDQERYERDLAEKALRGRKRVGTWLLRHSSYNRPVEDTAKELLQRTGVRYYALSFISNKAQIEHKLLTQKVGYGWGYSKRWFSNFLDCLEYVLVDNDLPYSERISKYVYVTETGPVEPAGPAPPTIQIRKD